MLDNACYDPMLFSLFSGRMHLSLYGCPKRSTSEISLTGCLIKRHEIPV